MAIQQMTEPSKAQLILQEELRTAKVIRNARALAMIERREARQDELYAYRDALLTFLRRVLPAKTTIPTRYGTITVDVAPVSVFEYPASMARLADWDPYLLQEDEDVDAI